MAPNFSKNAIIKGYIDYFCLICEFHLRDEDETTLHIAEKGHKKNIKATSYVEDYKEDYIKKINSRYFCELCNRLLSVLAKVRIHITEPLHIYKKRSHVFKRRDNIVIAFDKLVINELSWHGLYETNACAICSLEYDDEDEHKADATHIIKLIEITVEFDRNDNFYRKIDETFQCLTCNMVGALNNLVVHFDQIEHKNKYEECCEAYHKLLEVKSDKSCKDKNSKQQSINHESNKNDKEKGIIKPNTETECEKSENMSKESNTNQTNKQKPIQNTTQEINESDSKYKYDENCEPEICKVLNTSKYITHDENGMPWCILCNWVMSSHKIAEHLNGKHHQTILKFHTERVEKYKNINKISKRSEDKNNETIYDNSMLLNSVDTFQKNGITINFESKIATCKKCRNILEYSYDAINNHIKGHGKVCRKQKKTVPFPSGNVNVGDNNKMLFTSPVYVKKDKEEDNIDTNYEQKNTNIISNNESEELSKVVQCVKKPKKLVLKRVLFTDFVEILTSTQSGIPFQDVIVNNKFVINMFSIGCFTAAKNNVIECILCEKNMAIGDIFKHLLCPIHDKKVNNMFLIIEMDSEFIREISANKFHCGFCNIVETLWEEMQAHVKTSSHKEAKNSAEWRLAQYKTEMASETYQTQTDVKFNMEFFKKFL